MQKRYAYSFVFVLVAAQLVVSGWAKDVVDVIPGLFPGGITIPAFRHEAHFQTASDAAINQLNDNIARSIRPFPVAPSAGGLTYRFDPATGSYEQTTGLLGPVFSDRPQTLGLGKFNLAVALTAFQYDEFNGDDLGSLRAVAVHDTNTFPPPRGGTDDNREDWEHEVVDITFDIDLSIASLALAGTYGVTDRLDVGLVIPFVDADLDVRAQATLGRRACPLGVSDITQCNTEENFGVDEHGAFAGGDRRKDGESATGLGDIIVAAKYLWLDEEKFDVATGVRVKFGSGDEDDFLGTGSITIRPSVIGDYQINEFLVLNGNLGVEFDLDNDDDSAVVYSVGVYGGNSIVTGTFDVFGRHRFDGDEDTLDASLGVKWRPAEDFILSVNLITPLNDDGLRSDLIGTVGLEYRR